MCGLSVKIGVELVSRGSNRVRECAIALCVVYECLKLSSSCVALRPEISSCALVKAGCRSSGR